jgi:membrane-associated phospholipid phosphatase
MIPYEMDLSWVIAFQSMGDWLVFPMRFFSFLGTEEFYILLMPILYWCIDAKLGIRVGFMMVISSGLNLAIKMPFRGPRPYWVSTHVRPLWGEIFFGIPSNHAQTAVSVWGTVAVYVRRAWAWVIAVFLMVMIGLSRTFLGAHFFVDMLAGWLIGALLLWLYLRYWEPVATWASKQPLQRQILYAFLLSMGIIFFAWIAKLTRGDFVLPEEWIVNAARATDGEIAPYSLEAIFTLAGTLFGFLTGVAWLASRDGWQARGPLWKRFARYVVGLIGVIVIWYGLGAVFPRGEALLPYILRFIRYALLGVWIAAGAPLFFTKLKLT